jgi:cytosine/adenosine deaminase-related metal-dependent hydrolase
MRQFTADFIYTIASEPLKNGVITVDDDGTILDVGFTSDNKLQVEYHQGIICPGFINTHCHLELSHMHAQLQEKTGIGVFIEGIISKRGLTPLTPIKQAIEHAEKEMIKNGIVAVGDISNDNNTFEQKAKGNLLYHTFIEVFNLDANKAQETFNKGINLEIEYKNTFNQSHRNTPSFASISPHAPYTMSEKLLQLINESAAKNKTVISIHNQESEAENELFISNTGALVNSFKKIGFNIDLLRKTGINSLYSTLPLLSNALKIMLVHNTFTSKEDVVWAQHQMETNRQTKLYWCTCPNANLYIENTLPDYTIFMDTNAVVTIGTDSLASNWSLSVLDELKTITKYFPEIDLNTLLTWATKNGANCLGFEQLGTIEKGKKPGLNLLKNMDEFKIVDETTVLRLI